MTDTTTAIAPVLKTITVKAGVEKAFRVFTEGFDSWWPRTHHIGKSPMTRSVIEGCVGGRCYSEQEDGTECEWAQILEWDPPHRFVMAWKVTPQWGYEPDVAKSSEVEVRFTTVGDSTRVDLEHRHFDRHGVGADTMRAQVDSAGGWGTLLEMFRNEAEGE